MDLQNFKDTLEEEALRNGAIKFTRRDALSKGLCIVCAEPALPKCYSEAGRREYTISGTCEKCFDEMWVME